MFKKYLATAVALTIASSGFCAVPIFSSTDIFENSNEIQQIEITPVSNSAVSNPVASNDSVVSFNFGGNKQTTNAVDFGQIQNANFKNAIQNLEGAEVGIRETLVDYKVKYSDAKVRYDASKAECNVLKKQVRAHEKKLKEIERTKKTIAKNITE